MVTLPLFPDLDLKPPLVENSLEQLLTHDLDFRENEDHYGQHNFHSFPAKFPPQLPRKFIQALTHPGDVVLDPMGGSGTTLVEAYQLKRRAIGLDIDPLAIKIAQVKVTPFDRQSLIDINRELLNRAYEHLTQKPDDLRDLLQARWDESGKDFIDYWFLPETQLELMALVVQIEKIDNPQIRAFFELAFSSTIITKNGGVSLALDLAHTRPHRAKKVVSKAQGVVWGSAGDDVKDHHRKVLRSTFEEFNKRVLTNIKSVNPPDQNLYTPHISFGNAQAMPLPENSVDLIVTSPPYASNAIDYMRAHKFSLIWLGHSINGLSEKRNKYIGNEAATGAVFENLPLMTAEIIASVQKLDIKKGLALSRYYSEMTRVLCEIFRVLRPGKAAVLVVGSSVMRGIDVQTQYCLAEIGHEIGFMVPQIGIRTIDRDRRMMPAGNRIDASSQIQQRMHVEYVIGYQKPG